MFKKAIVAILLGFIPLTAEERDFNIHSLNLNTPTNRSFKAVINGNSVFFRIGRENPEEVGIDRTREIRHLKIGEMLGLTPVILGYELDNGILITEFIEGKTPTPEKLHDRDFLQRVVRQMHQLHGYAVDKEIEKTTFDACRHFYAIIQALNIPHDKEQVPYWFDVMYSFENGYYDGIRKAICHGDLYHGNLLESDDGKIYLIDWEYTFFGYVIDDLGKLCSDTLTDEEIQFVTNIYWGSPDLFLKLKQNVFLHELVHYLWCLMQAHNNPSSASAYHQRALLMQENLNRAAPLISKPSL